MLVVGLTGGIGSGKSEVSKLFADLGGSIIDTDIIAKQITQAPHASLKAIIDHFGVDIIFPNGELDRRKLRQIIFAADEERKWLEELLHPYIREAVAAQLRQVTSAYCIVVIPLLFEVSPFPYIDRVLVVDTSPQHQIMRVMQRDKLTKEEVQKILSTQASRQHRLNEADDVILNDGLLADLKPQVKKLHQLYTTLGKT